MKIGSGEIIVRHRCVYDAGDILAGGTLGPLGAWARAGRIHHGRLPESRRSVDFRLSYPERYRSHGVQLIKC